MHRAFIITVTTNNLLRGGQWLSGSVRLKIKSCFVETPQRHYVVYLRKTLLSSASYWLNPGRQEIVSR